MRKSQDITDGSEYGGSEWHVIFESISDGVLILDTDNTILEVNGAVLTALGLRKDQVIGRKCYELLHGANEVLALCPHQKMLETGQAETAEVYVSALAATCLVTASPVSDKKGRCIKCVHTIKNINERIQAQRALKENEERFRLLYQQSPLGYQSLDVDGCFLEVNPAWLELMGYCREEVIGHSFSEFIIPEQQILFAQRFPKFKQTGHTEAANFTMLRKDGRQIEVEIDGKFSRTPDGEMKQSHCVLHDVTNRRAAEKKLKQIEWLLTKKVKAIDVGDVQQPYGDLSTLNTSGLLIKTVGHETLYAIAMDYLELLETSAAIYERNGDYAIGLFTSGWCRFLDAASRGLCETADNQEALDCGRWHCHESCWKDASLASMESGEPVDVACLGGLHLYAVPIFAGGEVVGSMNFGYGDPPRDLTALKDIADRYHVDADELSQLAQDYETRPLYIIELAKRRLQTAACLIGEMVDRKQANTSLCESEHRLRQAQEMAHLGHWHWDVKTGQVEWCREVYRIFHLDPNEFTPHIDSIMSMSPWPEESQRHQELIQRAMENHEPGTFEQRFLRPDGSAGYYFSTFRGLYDEQGELVAMEGTVQDVTDRKQSEEALKESESKFRRLSESNIIGVLLATTTGEILEANDEFLRMVGYSRDDLASGAISWKAITPAAYSSLDEKAVHQLATQGIMDSFEKEYICKDGRRVPVFIGGALLEGTTDKVICYAMDLTEQRLAARALEESQRTLSTLMDNLPGFCYRCQNDPDWTMTFISDGIMAIAGYSPDEIKEGGLISYNDLIDPRDREWIWDCVQKAIEAREPFEYEYRLLTREGELKWMWERGSGVYSETGELLFLEGFVTDITERKATENELVQKTDELEFLNILTQKICSNLSMDQVIRMSLEGIGQAIRPDLALIFLKQGEALILQDCYVSDEEVRHKEGTMHKIGHCLCGISVAEGVPVFSLDIHKDVRCVFDDCKKAGIVSFAALPLIQGDHILGVLGVASKTERHFEHQEAYLKTLANEIGIGLQNAMLYEDIKQHRDELFKEVAERKQAEASRQKFAMLADSSSEFIGMCDLDLNPIYVNRAGMRMVGLADLAAACEVKVQDYFFPEDQRFIAEEFFPRVLREGDGSVEIRLRHFQTGEPIWVYYYLFSVRDAGGEIVGWATVSRDITERKRVEAEREKLLKTLERKNEELESIVYVSSHDLKSPLVNIQGFSEELKNQCHQLDELLRNTALQQDQSNAIIDLIDSSIPESLEFIRSSGVKMESLINGLLVVSRASRHMIDPIAIDMNELISSVQESFAFKGKEQSVEFVLDDLPPCYGDRLQIDQVFTNLLGNAIKHLASDRPGQIHISGHVDKGDCVYCVADNGIGISEQHQGKIFELFYRLDPHREGEGIGLTVVKRIVENHSGQVWFESVLGQGSRFYVRLPGVDAGQ